MDKNKWPLLTMRQMDSTTFNRDDILELIKINAKYPESCDEYWLAEGYPFTAEASIQRAKEIGKISTELEKVGIIPGFQQGVTLGHGGVLHNPPKDCFLPPDDAFQVDSNGVRTEFFCPTSPYILKHEEIFAETYVREGKLSSFWLDDDLRMGFRAGPRLVCCWCDRCLALLNEKAGTSYTREEFIERLSSDADKDNLRAVWAEFKAESLAKFAAAARRGAKRANPDIRMAYQAIASDTIVSGEDNRLILEALSDGFRDTVGIRTGHGFYDEVNPRSHLPLKMLAAAREAERCRAYPNWNGTIAYEQENYPHYAMEKSAEAIVKEGAIALAVGCDTLTQYWYSSAFPEPFDHYEDVARITAAWRPYMERLSALAKATHLGGVTRPQDEKIMIGKDNTFVSLGKFNRPRSHEADTTLALMGIPVTIAESGSKSFYKPEDVPTGQYRHADREALLDKLDDQPGGPVCVRTGKVHPLLVYPRVDAKQRTVAVTFVNTSIGKATGIPVKIRRPKASKAILTRPCQDDAIIEVKPSDGDELSFTLPDLSAWEMCTVFLN